MSGHECLLSGHAWRRYQGHGEHAGREFDVCLVCGVTKAVAIEVVSGKGASDDGSGNDNGGKAAGFGGGWLV